jgi:ubiquitin C
MATKFKLAENEPWITMGELYYREWDRGMRCKGSFSVDEEKGCAFSYIIQSVWEYVVTRHPDAYRTYCELELGRFFPLDESLHPLQRTKEVYHTLFHEKPCATCWDDEIPIFVKTMNGKTVTVHVKVNETVYDGKKRFYETHENQPLPEDQRIIFCGRQLEDNKTWFESGVHGESTLHMIMRLRGC